jgi:Flavin containing amine oxidoreductase
VLRDAGLAAARQLRASGHRVIILEGNGRAGGRVYTKRLEVRPRGQQAVYLTVIWGQLENSLEAGAAGDECRDAGETPGMYCRAAAWRRWRTWAAAS